MKIKNQYIISILVFVIVLVIISASVFITDQQVAKISNQEQVAGNIQTGASNLSYLSNDYFLYQNSSLIVSWQSQFSILSLDLSNLNSTNPDQQTLVNNVQADMQSLNTVFNSAVSFLQNAPRNESVRVLPEFQTEWSSLGAQNQEIAFHVATLSNFLNSQANQLKQANNILIYAMLGAFGAYFVTVYFIVYRRTLKSISKLQDGTRIIGSGNLDYSIAANSNDEVGELTQAFNQMTTSLKNVTASKTELEHAQYLLKESEQRWATTLGSIGDAVIAADVAGRVMFMNGVAEALTRWTLDEASTKPVKEVFHIINEHTRMDVEDPVAKVLEKGLIVGLANHTVLVRKDGTEVAIDDSGAPIKDKNGTMTGVVLVFRDITERKKADMENQQLMGTVQQERDRLSALVNSIADEVWFADTHGEFTLANPAAQKEFANKNGSVEADVAKLAASLEVLRPDGSPRPVGEAPPLRALKGEVIRSEDEAVRTPAHGELRYRQVSAAPVKDSNGNIIGSVSIVRDITELKQMQVKLEEYAKNLEGLVEERTRKLELSSLYARSLLEASLDPLVTISPEGKITDVNNATETVTGRSREELIGSDFSDYFTEPEKARAGYKQFFTRGFVRDYPLAIRQKTGKITYVLYNATVYRNEKGETQGVFAAARDITERKKAEERYRTLFETIDEGFCIIEMIFDAKGKPADYRYLEINSSFERQTGLHDAKGKLMRRLAPNHEEYWFETYGKVAVTGEPVRFTSEAKALNRWYDVYAFPVGEGKIRNVAILFNDITEHKKLEKQLQEKERLAAIGATAGMVGHDIRNPLQTVTGELYLAKGELKNLPEGDTRESLKESLDIIEEQTIYVNKIVADLQDYAKPLTPKPEEVNLENTIKTVLSSVNLRSTDQPEGINIEYNINEDFPKLKVDESYLRRIIQNLVTNAIQAMPKGGNLTINATYKNSKAIITVEDTGEGIPINVRDKLFTPLVTTKSKGQGFGLAVVKRFTEGMGGTVTFESEVGKGTKFIISLPVIRGES